MILFLDFDGVLHPLQARDAGFFSCTQHLFELLRRHPEIRVVFSTPWRSDYPFDYLVEFVAVEGDEDLVDRFIGSTPDLSEDPDQVQKLGSRQREIERWLAENEMPGHHWLALDDMPELFGQPLPPNIYIVSPKYGLRENDVEAICATIKQLTAKCFGGRDHIWGYDGQTLTASRWTCDVCGKSKVG